MKANFGLKAMPVLAAATLLACGVEEPTVVDAKAAGLDVVADALGAELVSIGFVLRYAGWAGYAGDETPVENDAIDVDTVAIESDRVVLNLVHGGGCRRHDYSVRWNGAFLESQPPVMTLELTHDGNEDGCRALLHPTLRLPLQPIRDAYRAVYGDEGGSLRIRIDGADANTVHHFGPASGPPELEHPARGHAR